MMKKGEHTSGMTIERRVVAVRDGASEEVLDRVIREEIFSIKVNGKVFVSLACLPESLEELAVGFLRSEGVIAERSQVEAVDVSLEDRTVEVRGAVTAQMLERSLTSRFLTSGCGVVPSSRSMESLADDCLKVRSDYIVDRGTVMDLMHEMNTGAALFAETGAAHTAVLALDGRIAARFEDISRHNAVDKAIGRALMEGWDLSRGVLFSSGRLSLEIVMKCASGKIPIVVSRTAPMQMGVEVADKLLMTLVGFARGRRLNIYSHPWRIK